jgi:hypothetical protein
MGNGSPTAADQKHHRRPRGKEIKDKEILFLKDKDLVTSLPPDLL